ncbi:MAG: hypothetical protein MZV63_39115 [Marinilabiliales bacterium]|nr:hypothetical protein [Marinilabiliales bacterium]
MLSPEVVLKTLKEPRPAVAAARVREIQGQQEIVCDLQSADLRCKYDNLQSRIENPQILTPFANSIMLTIANTAWLLAFSGHALN